MNDNYYIILRIVNEAELGLTDFQISKQRTDCLSDVTCLRGTRQCLRNMVSMEWIQKTGTIYRITEKGKQLFIKQRERIINSKNRLDKILT